MHHSQLFRIIFLFITYLALSACSTFGSKPESPVVTLAGLQIVKADFFEQRFALDLRLQNPNDFVLPIRGMSYDLVLNGTSFASGVSASKVDVPALGEAVVKVESVTNLFSLYRLFHIRYSCFPCSLAWSQVLFLHFQPFYRHFWPT